MAMLLIFLLYPFFLSPSLPSLPPSLPPSLSRLSPGGWGRSLLTINKWLKVGNSVGLRHSSVSPNTALVTSRSLETARPAGHSSALGRRFRDPKPVSWPLRTMAGPRSSSKIVVYIVLQLPTSTSSPICTAPRVPRTSSALLSSFMPHSKLPSPWNTSSATPPWFCRSNSNGSSKSCNL